MYSARPCRVFLQPAEQHGKTCSTTKSDNADWSQTSFRGYCHRQGKLTACALSFGVEKFGKAWVFLKESEILIVARTIAILRAQLNGDLQILHRRFRLACQAIQRGHGINNVIRFGSSFTRTVQMLARIVPAPQIHHGNALVVMVFSGFGARLDRPGNALAADPKVNSRAVRKFFARTLNHAFEQFLGAMKFLLLKVLQTLFVSLKLLDSGLIVGVAQNISMLLFS